jgi:shikimate kinase
MTQAGPAPPILLVGMMGAGKSTVGHALAATTGWPYVDNDELVELSTGLPVTQLMHDRGVDALRAAESAALTEALIRPTPLVAGVAAGVVLDEANRIRLQDCGFTVYLRARVDTLVRRVLAGPARPWIAGDPEAALKEHVEHLLAVRGPLLSQVAALTIDVDDNTPEEIAGAILDAFTNRFG